MRNSERGRYEITRVRTLNTPDIYKVSIPCTTFQQRNPFKSSIKLKRKKRWRIERGCFPVGNLSFTGNGIAETREHGGGRGEEEGEGGAQNVSYAMQTSSCSQRDVHITARSQTGKRARPTNEPQKVAQLYYTLSECIMVHVGGEPLLDEDVRVSNHVITVLGTELVSLSSSPLSPVYTYVRTYVHAECTRWRVRKSNTVCTCHVNPLQNRGGPPNSYLSPNLVLATLFGNRVVGLHESHTHRPFSTTREDRQ